MNERRVVITGLGVVAPNGVGKEAFWDSMMAGRSAVGPITRFDASKFSTRFAAEVKDFAPHPKIPQEHLGTMDRAYQMGVTAAFQADAGVGGCLPLGRLHGTRGRGRRWL
jgi:3-oxoacyl-[acyl-carrier-protein] synthase II